MKVLKALSYLIDFCLLLGLSIAIYAWRIEPRWVKWEQIDMPLKNLPHNLVGKKIVQISDIHIGDQVNDEFIIKEFQKINQTKPDIVIYTGDFISPVRENQAPYDQLDHILSQKAEGTLATIAILGNHDYSILGLNGLVADSLDRMLQKYDIVNLRNESMTFLGLNIIGIDDYWGRNFKPKQALCNIDTTLSNIVLVHNPDVADLDVWGNYDSWILSGHTHGGQVRLPFMKPFRIPVDNKNFDAGQKSHLSGHTLYINRGIGHSICLRFNVRPEVTFFTLKDIID